ncbi:MAG: hypothetical protein L3J35_10085 [Bacteroidales bacterium]|nr:hypothetical protein [Bacteroidales bacterium]
MVMTCNINLSKTLLAITLIFFYISADSQSVSINTSGSLPHASSILDMSDVNNKGLLIPNVALTGTSDNTSVTSPATGLMIYNTATISDVTPGYYYYTGTSWTKFTNGTYTFENGLTENASNTVKLGGSLSEHTNIDLGTAGTGYNLVYNLIGTAFYVIQDDGIDMAVFRNDGNVDFLNNISSGEYINFDGIFGSTGYGFRERAGDLEYKKNTASTWTALPNAPPGGETMWWYKPTATNYIRPQDNSNVRIYDDNQTYGFYYNGSLNQYGGYFVTSSATSPTSAVVGFSDVLGSQTYGYLGYNGNYTNALSDLSIDGTAVYGMVEDKNRTAIFGRTGRDANTAAIIGYSDVWTAGYYYCYDNATTSHSGLYSQLIVDVTKTGNQTAVKGYSKYKEGTQNRGYTIGGAFYAIGNTQDSEGIDTYASTKGVGTYSWGIRAEVDSAETVYGIQVLAGTDGVTAADQCWGLYSVARTSDGNAVLGLGSNLSSIIYSGNGDGVIGGSDAGYGVIGYHHDGTAANSYGVLGHSIPTANFFYHKEDAADGDDQSTIYAWRSCVAQNDGTDYSVTGTNEAVEGYTSYGDSWTFGVTGHFWDDNNGRSGGILGAERLGSYWGSLAYRSSTLTTYGVYANGTTTYGSGGGKNNKIGIGVGSYGDLAGAWFKGNIYGTITKGERFAQYISGKTYTNNLIVSLENNGNNERIPTYVPVSTSADIYLRGTGQLLNGKASITFDEKYKNIISDKIPVIVTVTPIGETQGIHLTSLKTSGFGVAENNSGKGNIQFTWIAVAVRKAYENPNNPKEVLSYDFDSKLDNFMFNENDLNNSGKPIWWDGKQIRFDALPEREKENKNNIDNNIIQINREKNNKMSETDKTFKENISIK